MNESAILDMVDSHYHGDREPLSCFSSWAASIHLVLCNASYLKRYMEYTNVHVAVMDTEQVDDEVLVWHVPQLIDLGRGSGAGVHEHLAYGPIRGNGYKAVPLENMVHLADIIPDVDDARECSNWGFIRRAKLFDAEPEPVDDERFLARVKETAGLFEGLALPVAIALINARRRPWTRDGETRRDPTQDELDIVLRALGSPEIPVDWIDMPWLRTPDMVNTREFPDVQQEIDFLRALVRHKLGKHRHATVEETERRTETKGSKGQIAQLSPSSMQGNASENLLCGELAKIEI
ncbi:hypothetical protein K491DRAFT_779862 [Lophiostoma macrostomum CBS 122681]|uniref:Uncharacterized protein n=1 Tax=Lophiostoma macrostomum CBS 122681 TaxID=1314788 RepID=A0A6A6T270_9PLEO|nr:hypothetical protein K491DRAFT_779862 [Lophiostoma macrostomum CBS 122681]